MTRRHRSTAPSAGVFLVRLVLTKPLGARAVDIAGSAVR
jgi:hypothetical protein